MSYYNGEEVTYIGEFLGDGSGHVSSDTGRFVVDRIGTSFNIQYCGYFNVNKGDIIYIADSVDFPLGGYFKAKITYNFTSEDFYSNYSDAETSLYYRVFNETCDIAVYGGQSEFFEYLGKDFNLSQLTDEKPTPKPTPEPTVKPSEGVGEEITTLYGFSTLKVDVADGIIDTAGFTVSELFISVVPIAFIGFAVAYGLKRAVSYFKIIAGGRH